MKYETKPGQDAVIKDISLRKFKHVSRLGVHLREMCLRDNNKNCRYARLLALNKPRSMLPIVGAGRFRALKLLKTDVSVKIPLK
jgi:hypothetical protein